MASYKIKLKASAEKELEKLPKQVLAKTIAAIQELASNPFPHGVKKLTGFKQTYHVRVGNYRILYTVSKNILVIEIICIRHRKDAYRR